MKLADDGMGGRTFAAAALTELLHQYGFEEVASLPTFDGDILVAVLVATDRGIFDATVAHGRRMATVSGSIHRWETITPGLEVSAEFNGQGVAGIAGTLRIPPVRMADQPIQLPAYGSLPVPQAYRDFASEVLRRSKG